MANPTEVIFFGAPEVYEGFRVMKPGDVVLDMALQGVTEEELKNLGLPAVFGCVEEVGEKDNHEPYIVLWSTIFGIPSVQRALGEGNEGRTFKCSDVAFMTYEPAETYIPRESRGKFKYGQRVISSQGVEAVLEAYFNDIVVAIKDDGQPYSGGRKHFKSLKK